MTIEEARCKAQILADLNLAMWKTSSDIELAELRKKFRANWYDIQNGGYKILRRKVYDPKYGYKVPKYKIREDNSEQCINIVDNSDKRGINKGDCTTRCICFCTGEDYLAIQKEQMANVAKTKHSYYEKLTWRSTKVWKQSLLSRGFSEINLPRRVSRKVFLKLFKDCGIDDGVIATRSSGHVAAIDMKSKKILDIWNSSGGRIITIFVPNAQKDLWTRKINAVLG